MPSATNATRGAQAFAETADIVPVGIGAISSSAANASSRIPPEQSYDAAMLKKVQETAEVQGEATVKLIENAAPRHAPSGTGSLINDVA